MASKPSPPRQKVKGAPIAAPAMPPAPPAGPMHLAASMRVVAAEQRRRFVTTADAREAVLEVAERMASGAAGPESELFAAKLEKVTGVGITELAQHAKAWPTA